MTPQIAVDVVANDKTDSGFRSAEKRSDGFAKRTQGLAGKSGFAKLNKEVDKASAGSLGLAKLGLNLDKVGGSLTSIAETVSQAVQGFMSVSRLSAFATTSEEGLAGMAAAGEIATGAFAATTAAVLGLGAATYLLGSKWAGAGAEIGRTAQTLGVTTDQLQEARAAAERFGVATQSVDASIDGLGMTLRDARFGANNQALAALNQLGIKLKFTKDGAIDTHQALLDLADAIARQKDPYTQQKVAQIFGVTSMLPALRQGSQALKTEGAFYAKSGAELTPDEVSRSTDVNRHVIATRQGLGAIEKTGGMAAVSGLDAGFKAIGAAKSAVDKAPAMAAHIADAAAKGLAVLGGAAKDLAVHGFKAAEDGAKGFAGAALDFAARIERQESRGRQFDKQGRPLTSARGAVGAMQMLPETARETAVKHGVAWDAHRFETDKAYNEQLGRLHLADLGDRYGGDETLTAAAYNAGEGNVAKWIKRFGDPRKGQISDADFAAAIPFKETRDYVANTAKADITVTFKNAPAGTSARVTSDPGVAVKASIATSMTGAG